MPPRDLAAVLLRSGAKFRIGPLVIDPAANEVRRGAHVERVEPKAMEVLVCLAARAGEAVSREALAEAVWPDVVVTEGTLTRCVSQLRKAMGDEARAPAVIETIPRVGYRLIAPVAAADALPVPPAAPPAAPAPPPEAPEPSRSVARRQHRLAGVSEGTLLALGVAVLSVAVTVWAMRASPSPPVLAPIEPLTSLPGSETGVALSPDGSRIAFEWSGEDEGTLLHAHIFVKTLGAGEPVRLTRGESTEIAPAWSPDGREVAFFRFDDEAREAAIYRVDVLGREERKVRGGYRGGGGLTWAPDGGALVYAVYDATFTLRIAALDLATLTERMLTAPPPSARDSAPRLSPDGRWIVFERAVGRSEDLYRIPRDGGSPERLTFDGAVIDGHTWTPDGEAVVFVSSRGGAPQLWRLPVPGGTPHLLPGISVRNPQGLEVTPDGAYLLFEDWDIEIDLWTAPAGAGADPPAPTRLVGSTAEDVHPALSPDGTRLAFVSTRSGAYELWRAHLTPAPAAVEASGLTRLTAFGGPIVAAPQWAPDGRRIAFEAHPDGHADLFVVDAEGGAPRRLTTSDANDRVPRWSRDGQRLYFASDRSGSWEVWVMPAAGGEARQLTRGGGFAAMESADGQTLYYARQREEGLWAMPVAGGPAVRVSDHVAHKDWGSWTVDETGIYVVDRRPPQRLARLDPATGALIPLGPVLDGLHHDTTPLALAPGGRAVVFERVARMQSDLVRVRLPAGR